MYQLYYFRFLESGETNLEYSFWRPYLTSVLTVSKSTTNQISAQKRAKVTVTNNLSTPFGLNKRSPLCSLPGFDVTKQLLQDIIHTLLESVIQYEVRLVLLKFINNGNLTLSQLNLAIQFHTYGYTETLSKPPPLKQCVFNGDKKYKLKYNAYQTQLFLRIFPFLLAPFVRSNDEYYSFIKTLLEIVNIIFSPHYLVHLPESIKLLGQLVRSLFFSFEAAHRYFKETAQKQNFKSLKFSLAKRCQFLECLNFGNSFAEKNSHPFFASDKKCGVLSSLSNDYLRTLRSDMDACSLLPGFEIKYAYKVSWIILYGTKYATNGIIAVSVIGDPPVPKIVQIKKITLISDYVYFKVNPYHTILFEKKFQSYCLEIESLISYTVPFKELVGYNVFHIKFSPNGLIYVSTKCNIDEYKNENRIFLNY
ncbi:uncharacterized protein LOC136092063 [Hydra vulgaris]|uniref:Uncharacterized protein LOC136092063 n=1 Tax=Hydra vulgaris TaxID=6087 RepID=A0ABM4DMR5_HYDVU